jgi:thiol-disulfide isomerase/thioredoxin
MRSPRRSLRVVLVLGTLAIAQLGAYAIYLRVQEARAPREVGGFPFERVDRPSPDLTFKLPDMSEGRLADHRGRPVLVHFWATWCQPCRKELPELLALARTGDGLDLLAVSVDEDWELVREFFNQQVPREVRLAIGNQYKEFGGRILPDTYLVDRAGIVRAHLEGARPWGSSGARAFVRLPW